MNTSVLTRPLPQAYTSQHLRDRRRVTSRTPDFTPLTRGINGGMSDIDRLVYRDSRNVLCLIPHAAVIEYSGAGTLVIIAEHTDRPVPAYQAEAYGALSAPDSRVATVLRAGDAGSTATALSAVAALTPRTALFIEEKRATENISAGERRMLDGIASAQRTEVWRAVCGPDGTLRHMLSADGACKLTPRAFMTYAAVFGGAA